MIERGIECFLAEVLLDSVEVLLKFGLVLTYLIRVLANFAKVLVYPGCEHFDLGFRGNRESVELVEGLDFSNLVHVKDSLHPPNLF